jgi:hypothetical protein
VDEFGWLGEAGDHDQMYVVGLNGAPEPDEVHLARENPRAP